MERKMNLDEITQYINEESIRGEIARELSGIISDYQAGTISLDDKNSLIEGVVEAFKVSENASDEVTVRWLVAIASVAVQFV